MNNTTKQQLMHYKDRDPIETVKTIKNILDKAGIQIEEIGKEKDEIIGTYSVRINIKGTNIGTNGKGVSKEFAQASGYAEFMERYQNGLLIKNEFPEKATMLGEDVVVKTAEQIVGENNAYIREYFKQKEMQNLSEEEKVQNFKELETVEKMTFGRENKYETVAFYNLATKHLEYLPKHVYERCYGSNGMCAGNTPEEAIIQGLSEIFERVAQKRVFAEKKAMPDIPEDYIKKFPYVYEMYSRLKSNGLYQVFLKDCSFGGQYPVAALIIIKKNTGCYGVRFGCSPDFGVAMERTFTEATQGQNIDRFASMNQFDFSNKYVDRFDNISNSFKIGLAQYPYQFITQKSYEEFVEPKDVSNMTNKEILKEWLQALIDRKTNILIRNNSILGFPAYHIIIPGLSELQPMTVMRSRLYNTRVYSKMLLDNIDELNQVHCGYITTVIRYLKDSLLENEIQSYLPWIDIKKCPGEQVKKGTEFLACVCHLMRSEYDKAGFYIKRIISVCKEANISEQIVEEYLAIDYYCDGMQIIQDHKSVIACLEKIFSKHICDKTDELFCDPSQILHKVYFKLVDKTYEESVRQQKAYYEQFEKLKRDCFIDQKCNSTIEE